MTEENEKVEEVDTTQTDLTWEEADIQSSQYVRFETDIEKRITIQNWKLVRKMDRFTEEFKIFFTAEVTNEDGSEVQKVLENSSNRLRVKLKGIIKDLDPTQPVVLSITRTGEKTNTQYMVKKL